MPDTLKIPASVETLATGSGYTPTRRDLLASDNPTDSWGPIAYAAALQSRAWPDPDFVQTGDIINQAVENTISGTAAATDAAKLAVEQIKRIPMPDAPTPADAAAAVPTGQ